MKNKKFEDMSLVEQSEHNLKLMKQDFRRMNKFYLTLLSILTFLVLFIRFFK